MKTLQECLALATHAYVDDVYKNGVQDGSPTNSQFDIYHGEHAFGDSPIGGVPVMVPEDYDLQESNIRLLLVDNEETLDNAVIYWVRAYDLEEAKYLGGSQWCVPAYEEDRFRHTEGPVLVVFRLIVVTATEIEP